MACGKNRPVVSAARNAITKGAKATEYVTLFLFFFFFFSYFGFLLLIEKVERKCL